MMTKEEKRKKAAIVKLLKGKKCYEKEIDDQLIDQYIFNLKIISEAQQDVVTRGVMVQLGKDSNFMQQNFALGAIHNAIKSNNTILKQLGLEKIQIAIDAKDDALKTFQSLLN